MCGYFLERMVVVATILPTVFVRRTAGHIYVGTTSISQDKYLQLTIIMLPHFHFLALCYLYSYSAYRIKDQETTSFLERFHTKSPVRSKGTLNP